MSPAANKIKLEVAARWFKAAQRWSTEASVGGDFPHTAIKQAGFRALLHCRHPLVTDTSVSYNGLQFAYPSTVQYRHFITASKTVQVKAQVWQVGRRIGGLEATVTSVENSKGEVEITISCPDNQKMAEITAAIAEDLGKSVLENCIQTGGDRVQRKARWIPKIPYENKTMR